MFIAKVDPGYVEDLVQPVVVIGLGMVTEQWELPFHSHQKAELLFADTGLIELETENNLWIIPPQGAVWIPGGLIHRAKCSGNPRGFVAFIAQDSQPGLPATCCTMSVSPFLRALLERIAALPQDFQPEGVASRLTDVLLDEIIAAPQEWLNLPMPEDKRLRLLADRMLSSPEEKVTLEQWASRLNMSERNLSRLFAKETGYSINRWRRQMHVIKALPLLAQGHSVQTISEQLGYENAGAFVTMFRKATGTPPRRFMTERMKNVHSPLNVPAGGFYEYG
ncbi:AraC family transcriptional regulator [Enterobacteriaceae bacterium 89]|nr:AraC family transcriptional regulator [Enterobacteriaceae bacterium 89]